MEEKEYNGWTNRETWATALHIDNDYGMLHNALTYVIEEIKDSGEVNINRIADGFQYQIEEDLLTFENVRENDTLWLMLTDIGSLYRVNWREIAQHYVDQVNEGAYL